jgi:nucleoside-diphosphate-sugar epimerase
MKRIFFTGGSGKAGNHVIQYLINQGYRVLNADLVPLYMPGVDNLTVDITDSGQIFNVPPFDFNRGKYANDSRD